jgi:peroxiredoxin
MKYHLSRIRAFSTCIAALLLTVLFSQPARAIPAVGDSFPAIELRVPAAGADRDYLGLSRGRTFTVADIGSPIVVIEFFSIYCPHCQADAPATVDLFGRIKKDSRLSGRVRMIGIGVGNSEYEVGIFKKKYRIPFPLFEDGAYAILNLLDVRQTPTYIVVKIAGGKATVAHTLIGRIKDVGSFVTLLSSLR